MDAACPLRPLPRPRPPRCPSRPLRRRHGPRLRLVASLTAGLSARGWRTTHVQTDPLSGRFIVTDPDTGEECEVDVLKEAFWAPPAQTPYGPVLSLDDVIGTKVRALADRGTVRDLIDVQAASRHRSTADLESLGRRRAHDEFSLEDLRDRLVGADWYEDEDYTAYGLTFRQIEELKAWALEWAHFMRVCRGVSRMSDGSSGKSASGQHESPRVPGRSSQQAPVRRESSGGKPSQPDRSDVPHKHRTGGVGVKSRKPLTCRKQAGSRLGVVQSAAHHVQIQDPPLGHSCRSGA